MELTDILKQNNIKLLLNKEYNDSELRLFISYHKYELLKYLLINEHIKIEINLILIIELYKKRNIDYILLFLTYAKIICNEEDIIKLFKVVIDKNNIIGTSILELFSKKVDIGNINRFYIKYKYNSISLLTYALFINKKNVKIIEFLLKNKADPNICYTFCMAPITIALKFNQYENIDLLLKYGTNPNIILSNGKSLIYTYMNINKEESKYKERSIYSYLNIKESLSLLLTHSTTIFDKKLIVKSLISDTIYHIIYYSASVLKEFIIFINILIINDIITIDDINIEYHAYKELKYKDNISYLENKIKLMNNFILDTTELSQISDIYQLIYMIEDKNRFFGQTQYYLIFNWIKILHPNIFIQIDKNKKDRLATYVAFFQGSGTNLSFTDLCKVRFLTGAYGLTPIRRRLINYLVDNLFTRKLEQNILNNKYKHIYTLLSH